MKTFVRMTLFVVDRVRQLGMRLRKIRKIRTEDLVR